MNYTKLIRYGNNIEIFEYELAPPPHRRRIRKKDKEKDEGKIFAKRKDNVLQAKRNFRRLVGANLDGEKPLLMTITYEENMTDITVGYSDYKSFVQALRYRYGKEFNYIVVPEFQLRGAVHFHALFWSLPSPEVLLKERLTGYYKNVSPTLSKIWDHGFVFLKETDGHGKLSSYLAKYMAKAFVDRRLKNQKAYASSRHIKRPIIDTMIMPTLYQFVGENDLPILDEKYPTRRMGQCHRRWFKTSQQNIEGVI